MFKNKKISPLTLSVLLHILVLLILIIGDFTSTPPKSTPMAAPMQPITAVAVERKTVEAQINKIKQAKSAEEKRKRDKIAAARKAKEKKARAERLRKKKIADKKAKAVAAEKARKKKIAEKKAAEKKAAEKKAKRAQEEKRKKAIEKKKEAERKKKLEAAKEKAAQERLLEQQMAEEMENRNQARRRQVLSEIGRYTALITQTIQRNLITDKATMEGRSCKLTISLAPSGFVTNVVIGQGNRVVCDAAKAAIYKAGTLPVSKDPEVFKEMRAISLTVVPEF
ncbi:cell envelope integrity protein TolA [Thalassotalea piscium]